MTLLDNAAQLEQAKKVIAQQEAEKAKLAEIGAQVVAQQKANEQKQAFKEAYLLGQREGLASTQSYRPMIEQYVDNNGVEYVVGRDRSPIPFESIKEDVRSARKGYSDIKYDTSYRHPAPLPTESSVSAGEGLKRTYEELYKEGYTPKQARELVDGLANILIREGK